MTAKDGLKTAIVTGGNSGLGYHCAKEIAATQQWQVILACRNKQTATQAVEKMIAETGNKHIEAIALDLTSLASVREFARECIARDLPPLQAIVCNAGIQIVTGTTYTVDGYETTFAVNHLGHFLLVNLLLPKLISTARIVFVSSGTHDPAQQTGIPVPRYRTAKLLAQPNTDTDINDLKRDNALISGQRAYSTSKLCNIFCTYQLARRLTAEGSTITVNAFDPGLMPGTGLARDYNAVMQFAWNYLLPVLRLFRPNVNTAAQSGAAMARLILDPKLQGISGKYFEGLKEIRSSLDSYDEKNAADLWQTSEELVTLANQESPLSKQ